MITEKDMIETLTVYSNSSLTKDQFAVYINGRPAFIGKSKAYKTVGIAKGKIVDLFCKYRQESRKHAYEVLESLIDKGIVEIKQIV